MQESSLVDAKLQDDHLTEEPQQKSCGQVFNTAFNTQGVDGKKAQDCVGFPKLKSQR